MKHLKIKDHQAGTTYEGLGFFIEVNHQPMDLINATIVMVLTSSAGQQTTMDLDIIDVRGKFWIKRQIITLAVDSYSFEIEITKGNGDVKKYIIGQWRIR